MSRSGYSSDVDNWSLIKWRGAVMSALRGRRGQRLLRELADAMDAMEPKRLIAHELEQDGEHCALGVVGKARGLALDELDPDDAQGVAAAFDVADALAREIVFENDEGGFARGEETPEQRWQRVREWVARMHLSTITLHRRQNDEVPDTW